MMCPVGMPDTIKEILKEDFKEEWRGWLKFLFLESPLGWIGGGIVAVQLFLVTCTALYWLC